VMGPVSTRHAEVLKKLEMDILVGKYKQRERLVESDIMEKYGVTRNAVRKIFKEIEIKGIVTHVPNRGVRVAELKYEKAEELYSIRVILENYGTDLVFNKISTSQLDNLIRINREFQKAVEKGNLHEMMKINNALHQSIMDISGNSVLIEMLNQIRNRLIAIRHYVWLYPEHIQKSVEDHEILLEALRRKDIVEFKRVNGSHILAAFEIYTRIKDLNIS
jgi:DNA-binding GntR family transcriptional regulator